MSHSDPLSPSVWSGSNVTGSNARAMTRLPPVAVGSLTGLPVALDDEDPDEPPQPATATARQTTESPAALHLQRFIQVRVLTGASRAAKTVSPTLQDILRDVNLGRSADVEPAR